MNLKDVGHQATSELRTPTKAIGQIQHVAELLWQDSADSAALKREGNLLPLGNSLHSLLS